MLERYISNEKSFFHNFIGREYQQVASYVYRGSDPCDGVCHLYTLPYDFEYLIDLDNSFQGQIFQKVRQLEMDDIISFQYKLFQIIYEEFPFLEYFYISNDNPQEDNQH